MSALRVARVVLLVAVILAFAVSWSAADDWPPITPEEQAMTDVPQQPGAPAVILFHEEIADDTNNYHSVYMRIKVLSEAGRRYADVQVPYLRSGTNITEVSGRTVHADGSIVPFDGKTFDKVIVKEHGRRIHVKSFTLPDVQVGSMLEYRYNLRYGDNRAAAPRWILQTDLFQRKEAFKFTPWQGDLEFEHGRIGNGIAWTAFVPKGQAQPEMHTVPHTSLASTRQLKDWVGMELTDVPAFIEEPFMPPPDTAKWRVAFYYRIESKQEDYWKAEGKYWNKDVEGFVGRDKGVQEAVDPLISNSDTPEQKVRKIYAFVSQLENQSYNPLRPDQEQRVLGLKRNEGAEDVLRQRSGSHDDLTRLFAAMVRKARIPAWLMRVPDREQIIFDSGLLSTEQFDAEIAIVQLDGKEVFLDPGTKFCPYGLLNWRYSNNRGLRQTPDKGVQFGESPISEYSQAMITRLARLRLTEQGMVEGTLGIAFYGLEALNRRQEGGKTDATGRKKMLEDEIKSWFPSGSEVTLEKDPEWESAEKPLVAQFHVTSSLAASAGKRWVVPVHLFQINQKPLFASAQRTNPVYFYYPTREIDEVHITLPPNVEVESLPSNEAERLEYALYKTDHKRESSNQVFARRELVMAGIVFPVDRYKEVKGFYDKAKAGDDQPVILKASERAQVD